LVNTCIKSPSGSSRLEALIGSIEKKLSTREPVKWGEIGVYFFRNASAGNMDMAKFMKDPEVFCPVNFFDLSGLICDNDYVPGPKTLAIHLWNEIWRRGHLNKNATYHPGSIYERLKRKYLS
jgi:hypothetical protein